MRKIAIVGGGMGGLATAFDLVTKQPGTYQIAIYERDWRLGGKGASGRNASMGNRIEEHGLHILMGFYENVFEILDRCYRDLRESKKLPPAVGSWWNGVLHGMDDVFFFEPPLPSSTDGAWIDWNVRIDANEQFIGGPAGAPPSVKQLIVGAFKRFLRGVRERLADEPALALDLLHLAFDSVDRLDEHTADVSKRVTLVDRIKRILQHGYDLLLADEKHHRWFVTLYVSGLNLIGLLQDVLPHESTFRETLDVLDYKEWLARFNFLNIDDRYHRESAPVNAVYDLVFSRGSGFAAGSALYDMLLMLFNFKGHIFYKMAGGMGDIVFAPLYLRLLEDPDVTFHFFHDLTDIDVSDDQRIEALHFAVSHDDPGYDPIVHVTCHDDSGQPITLPCWSNEPGVQETKPGKHVVVTAFDAVVLAIPVGAIREKNAAGVARCQSLYADPKFAAMAEGMVTRATRAVQLWFDTDLAGLGWPVSTASAALGPVVGSYAPAYKHNSWADMSQVVPRETWGANGPQNIAYLCDVFEPVTHPAADKQLVHDDGIRWLEKVANGFWPAIASPFQWDKLHDPEGRQGVARFEAQYWRVNTDGSSQYVTGAQKTSALRLDPHGTAFENLFLAGDWVKTPLNAGCVEGAAMGGRIAARRIVEQSAAGGALRRAPSAPPYVTRDGDLPLLQPVVMGDVSAHGYVFKAERDRLDETLAAAFAPLGITCKSILPVVVAMSVQVGEIRSAIAPEAGYMAEAELGFWVPVRMKWDGGSAVGFYLPYLFVDDVAALLAGRDIYGFNKILGRFQYATDGDVDPTVVEAQVLHTLGKDSKLHWLPVAELTKKAPAHRVLHWEDFDNLISGLAAHLVGDHPEVALLEAAGISIPSCPVFFLKQVRAAGDGSRADLQQAISAHVRIEPGTLAAGRLADVDDEVTLTLTKHATLDIAGTLGLAADSSPTLGFWATFTATVERGIPFGPQK